MNLKSMTPVEIARFVLVGFYVERNITAVLSCFTEDITWIGPAEEEYFFGLDAIRAYFEAGSSEVPSCIVEFEDLQQVLEEDERAIVMGKFFVRTAAEMIVEVKQRCTMDMKRINGSWLVQHLHTSNIYEEMHEDAYFPKTVGHQTMDYMNRLLKEKSEVIEMITDNINGGLKGSNDDATYSFFYVNEGLCRMLGYTYDEFMEASHGCAVGAVYPPDLPGALAACEACFAKGPLYRAEYRMRKKDGSLIWILDSGKKTKAADGKMRINSILMDITEIKQTEKELQLERERYRIALENITEVMFEYDIKKDVLMKYQREGFDRGNPLRKQYIEQYLQTLEKDYYIHLDDIGTLKSFLLHELAQESIEIRMYQEQHGWIWIRVTGSYIFSDDHTPLKCIGIWSDINEEKLRLDSLIDLSQRDALTHLYHQKRIERLIRESLKEEETAALLIMDIDYFKRVNDSFGHLYGNKILLAVTKIINACAAGNELVGRIGGDEFLIYASGEEAKQLQVCAKQILSSTRQIPLMGEEHLTVSIGIAYHKDHEGFSSLFERADQAMYQAKQAGRNQLFILDEGGCL